MALRKKKKSSKKKMKGCLSFRKTLNYIKKNIIKSKVKGLGDAIKVALKYANLQRKRMKPPQKRIIPIPKSGGILPLIPIFAGLSALGALAGGASGVAKAISSAKNAKDELKESVRHNRSMEAIALGKGLYLKQYKSGMGIFL